MPELFVGPEHERRQRDGFSLTDRRMRRREVEDEIDYCMLCHDREKDSCSKGMVDAKTGELKKNPLGVALDGCPLEEKISEMHAMRQAGELVARAWRSSRSTTRCAPAPATASATTA